jgi:hypothetical protein
MRAAIGAALVGIVVGAFVFMVGLSGIGKVDQHSDPPPPQVTDTFEQITVPRPRVVTTAPRATTTTYPPVVTLPNDSIIPSSTPPPVLAVGDTPRPRFRMGSTATTIPVRLIDPLVVRVVRTTTTVTPSSVETPTQTMAGSTDPPATSAPPPTDPPPTDPPPTDPPETTTIPPSTDPPPTDPAPPTT